MADKDEVKIAAVSPETPEKDNDELSELEAEGVAGGVEAPEADAGCPTANYKCT